jgi:hypothetical protein
VAVAITVAKSDERQRVLPVIACRLHIGADAREELNADSHSVTCSLPSAQTVRTDAKQDRQPTFPGCPAIARS